MTTKPRIAFWFRYGAADNVELAHATPWIIERVARDAEIHYFSHRSRGAVPECISRHTVLHSTPFSVNRASSFDKLLKTLLWYLAIPFIGLRCRALGIKVIYIDDFLPLGSWVARLTSGAQVAVFVVDFLLDAYAEQHPWMRPAAKTVNVIEAASWRRLPLIFTRTDHAKGFLEKAGVPASRIHTVYDACDQALYRPVDREAARRQWGYENEVVLAHHGVLHPNKGIDRILGALPALMERHPHFRFLVIGSGPEIDKLKALAQVLGIADKVQFTGWLTQATDVNEALNAADIGLVMRTGHFTDHFHLTGALVHSMAVGLPTLAPRLHGIQEVLEEGKTGYLFEPDDMAAFQQVCGRLVEDAEERRRMGDEAHRVAQELFDVERAADKVALPLLRLAGIDTHS